MDSRALFFSRSPVLGKNGCVTSDLPVATAIGRDVLQKGGNAADAAIAMAAAVSVAMPRLCGLGGDCNCIYYDSASKLVSCVNGSGRSSEDLTLQKVKEADLNPDNVVNSTHGLLVTVPGAVAGMFSCLRLYGSGKLSMGELLAPATRLAETGVPLPPKIAMAWKNYFHVVEKLPNHADFLINGRTPEPGDIYLSPKLAKCFKLLASDGQKAFYQGPISDKIIKAVHDAGGLLTPHDLQQHLETSLSITPASPLCLEMFGFKIWEMAPNTIGLVALVALNLLKGFNLKALGHNSAEYIHLVAEALYIAFVDCWQYLCDPDVVLDSYKHLLTDKYAESRRSHIDPEKHLKVEEVAWNEIDNGIDTSYLTAVDSDGNACSFIFSVSSSFGSGIIPDDCGFVLHDRGKGFSFDEKSKNCFGPRKLPMHTIIPAMVTDQLTSEVVASMGVVGRWMQPQGHVQVLLNMLVFGMDPQTAIDKPRFGVGKSDEYSLFIGSAESLYVEAEIPEAVRFSLESKGHKVMVAKEPMGRGHIIAKQKLWKSYPSSEVWWAGCDRRHDGIALGI